MAGYDLGRVSTLISGAERVRPDTVKRFAERFARFNLPGAALRPTYGLAESTLYVATTTQGQPPKVVDFESGKLSVGQAQRCESGTGTALSQLSSTGSTDRADRRPGHPRRMFGGNNRRDLGARRQRLPRLLAKTGRNRAHVPGRRSSSRQRAHPKDPGCGPGTWVSCPKASCSSSAASRIS